MPPPPPAAITLPAANGHAAGGVSRELARLTAQIAEAQATLVLAQAANEQLVLAALRADAAVETAHAELQDIARAAEVDALTGLPNRTLLLDRFAHAIALAKRHGKRMALLFLDLNNFKHINDTLGHAAGDLVLQTAAQCLTAAVREADTVSRHGGDEFLVLVTEVSEAADAAAVAAKVAAALAAPRRLGGHVLRLTASIGIALYPDDGDDAATLIQRADAAMYRAKRHGLGGFAFHHDNANEPHANEPAATPLFEPSHPPLTDYALAQAEQQRHQAQLLQANEQLVIAALGAQQLQAAADEARARQTHFLALLAHELRNPLMTISTATALSARQRSGATAHSARPDMHAVIERQVAQMTRLLGDLVDVSRVSSGKLSLQRQRVDVALLVREAVNACRPAMDLRLQHFALQLPPEATAVDGDPARLLQILRNLLDNASKYTPMGGEIRLAVTRSAGVVMWTVADSGIGIGEAAMLHVFDPFVRDTEASAFSAEGLGLGLTVVRELVQAHGGQVHARSAGNGQGSQFVVTLPVAP